MAMLFCTLGSAAKTVSSVFQLFGVCQVIWRRPGQIAATVDDANCLYFWIGAAGTQRHRMTDFVGKADMWIIR